jgi:carnitine-CoA ligase
MIAQDKVYPQLVAARAASTPDRTYLTEVGGRSLSYGETHAEALTWAARFRGLGVARGDTVAIMLATRAEAVTTWLGLGNVGAVEVPVNNALRGNLLTHVLTDSLARVLVTEGRYLEQLAQSLPDSPTIEVVVVLDDADTSAIPVPTLRLADLTEVDGTPAEPAADDIGTIMYTSGTTGSSKGVLVTWNHLHATVAGSMPIGDLGPDDVFYAPFALYHVTGKTTCYKAALLGGSIVLRERFSTDAYWADVRRYGCTTTVLMGAMAQFLHRQPPDPDDATTPMRNVLMAPLIPEVEEFKARFGVRVCTVFNMTEVSSPITSDGWTLADATSCGRARPGYDCRIVDEHDEELPPGEVGELVVRADEPWNLMAGYWNAPEKTVEAWRNLFFHTGDALTRDADGNFYYVDRIKDVIRRRGENISSVELESEVLEHPEVFAVAAYGVPSEFGEDEVMIAVVPRPGATPDPGEIAEFLGPRVPAYMVPRYVDIVDDLPRTPTEKIRKIELRHRGVGPATWDRLAGSSGERPRARGAGVAR